MWNHQFHHVRGMGMAWEWHGPSQLHCTSRRRRCGSFDCCGWCGAFGASRCWQAQKMGYDAWGVDWEKLEENIVKLSWISIVVCFFDKTNVYIYDCMWICLQNHSMDSWMGDRRNILSFPTSWLGHLCLQYLAKSVKSFLVCSGSIDIWWHEIADLLINWMEGPIYIQITGWWFGTFFIFPYIGNNHPNWLSYFSEG